MLNITINVVEEVAPTMHRKEASENEPIRGEIAKEGKRKAIESSVLTVHASMQSDR